MAEQARAQLHIHTVGGVGEHIGAQGAHQHFEGGDHDEADDHDVERCQALVHQHLVDHHLEEQGCHQRENLQEEGGQHHFAQEAAIFDQGGDEPGDVELARIAHHLRARGHEQQAAGPQFLQFLGGDLARPLFQRRLDQRGAVSRARQNEEGSVLCLRNGGKRQFLQPAERSGDGAGLDLQKLGQPQQVVEIRRLTALAELMAQLRRVGGHTEKFEKGDEAGKARVRRRVFGSIRKC